MKLFAGNSNVPLAEAVAAHLGIELGKAEVGTFSDGEVKVEIQENVRGLDCFVLQSTCSPANTHLLELLIMIDALRRSSARRVTAVMPYYGYSRQDRKVAPRVPISAPWTTCLPRRCSSTRSAGATTTRSSSSPLTPAASSAREPTPNGWA
jgi:ribose-phosphate pyrophosphokinase